MLFCSQTANAVEYLELHGKKEHFASQEVITEYADVLRKVRNEYAGQAFNFIICTFINCYYSFYKTTAM
jgi:hypothetical protein